MKTKLFTIAMMVALLLAAITRGQAQEYDGPCLPPTHGLDDHQSAFCGTTQSIELVAGWNLISTYLAIEDPVEMLDMLKASIGENATEIQSEDNMTEFDGAEWFGDMDDIGLENEKGYFVNVITDCTVELTGTPANVGDFAINIHNGWNYIGFPSAVAIEVNTALAGFEAADGDQIQTDYGVTEYDGEWFGDFEAFEPGYGLMYFSNSEDVKTMVIQTGGTEARAKTVSRSKTKNEEKPRPGLDKKQ
jgi:hypothetical protein